ncbi:MAG: serine/threonine protein kinase [Planctomycetales bacterium]|nr:serine/threonine protein kinase [Planctomycetales bacterium]
MDTKYRSVFCGAATYSGLLTDEQLEDAVRKAGSSTPGPPLPLDQLEDEEIAQATIELGILNRWQVEQLKAGRTKFTLGPYRVIDSIGRGGMGHVFKAEHSMLGRIEACKVLPKSRTTPEAIVSFQREIRAQAQLDHPNLVRLSYAGQDGATYFFVTEYVPGTDLRQLVRKNGMLTMQEAATIIAQAAEGLHHAHENGLVHRDIKPGNLLVTPEGRTKVTDLGLAGFLNDDEVAGDDPRAGKIVGTADYLAPETIRTPADVRPVSDIYSLGCTLYYAVTGKVPFPGGTTQEKLRRHLDETPFNPARFNSELDDAFLDVLADMMAKAPERRIQSAAEVSQRLKPWTLDVFPNEIADQVDAISKSRSPAPPPIPVPPSPEAETMPHFLDEPEYAQPVDEPSGQTSQRTLSISFPSQETDAVSHAPRYLEIRLRVPYSRISFAGLLVPAMLLAALLITVVLLIVVTR